MRNLSIAVLAVAALLTTAWLATRGDAGAPAAAATAENATAAGQPERGDPSRAPATDTAQRQPTPTADQATADQATANRATTRTPADASTALIKEPTIHPAWVVTDVFGRSRTDPDRVDVAGLQSSRRVNPDAAEFSAELQQALGHELEQLRATFARLAPEIARVEAQEFARATESGFATRKPVEIEKDDQGNESFEVTIGVTGEESELVFGDEGATVLRVPTHLMPETNALRAAWLAEWLEFWHAALPLVERAGHLEAAQSDAIYEALHTEFEGVLAGFGVSLEELQQRRKKR